MSTDFPLFPTWEGHAPALEQFQIEVEQSLEEGRDPAAVDRIRAEAAGQVTEERLVQLGRALQLAPMRPDFPHVEPSDLEAIHSERPHGPHQFPIAYGHDELSRRMHGAWLARCIGCALGKPVETFMVAFHGLSSKERTKRYLTAVSAGEYPIRDYIPGTSPASAETGPVYCPASQREHIRFMETDDDIRYTVLGQRILLRYGSGFTTGDVMREWWDQLGYNNLFTAETQAYRNMVIRYRAHGNAEAWAHVDWNWVATHQNPYREWIGAQIRADSWGYAAPGNPALAAEFAWRDAWLSHVKNGIYGEMFCAAMIAAGFALGDPLAVIEAGLTEIPRTSRLAVEMRAVIGICQAHGCRFDACEAVLDEIYARLGHYHAVHTINNAALVVAALLLGGGDFEKTVTLAVMGGWDTDCNGATAGSIWGAMFGPDSIPKKWSDPLHDTLYSAIPDYHPIAISECAKISLQIAEKIATEKH
jgi:hypothetical protein